MELKRKLPERRCLGCMQSFPKKELVRVVRAPDGVVSMDLTGKKSGRGAYVCRSTSCLKKAVKARRLQNNLQAEISDELIEQLLKELENGNE